MPSAQQVADHLAPKPKKKGAAELTPNPFEKFSPPANLQPPVLKKDQQQQQEDDEHEDDHQPTEAELKAQAEAAKAKGAPSGKEKKDKFFKQTLQEAADAKREAQEAKDRLAEVERERQADQEKLKELETKLTGARTQAEFDAIQTELDTARKTTEDLTGKYKEVSTKNKFYNLMDDPDFQAEYIKPLNDAWTYVAELIGPEESQQQILGRIGNLQETSLQTANPDMRRKLEKERNILINQLLGEVDEFNKDLISSGIKDIIIKSKNRATAISNWEPIADQIKQKQQENMELARQKVRTRWDSAYSGADEIVSPDLHIADDLKSIMQSHNLVPDTSKDDAIAKDIIMGGGQYQPEDMARVIRQGAAYPVAIAKIKGLEQQLKEALETIREVRGQRTSGQDGRAGLERKTVKSEDKAAEEKAFFDRFAPPGQ